MVQAQGQSVPADIAFCELIGSSEFKYRIKTDIIVIHHGGCSGQNRDQERAGAFQKPLPPA